MPDVLERDDDEQRSDNTLERQWLHEGPVTATERPESLDDHEADWMPSIRQDSER